MKVYFLKVTTYNNTNRLGKAMAEFAVQYYQHRLTTEVGWLKMVDELKGAYWSLKRSFPKVRKDFVITDSTCHAGSTPLLTAMGGRRGKEDQNTHQFRILNLIRA